jgi:tRNA-specific 2-thiouridylase
MKQAGRPLVAYTLWLTSNQDISAVTALAAELGIPHRVIDARQAFADEVLHHTVRSYRRALTPNPCVVCNRKVKFPLVADHAMRERCTTLVTGHYARVRREARALLLRARDRTRDQSYFLCLLGQRMLRRVFFPLGELSAKTRRRRQEAFWLRDRCLAPSRDACFLAGQGLPSFLTGQSEPLERGPIVDRAGKVLGAHRGAASYTVGQRRGLGLPGGPWYVLSVDHTTNTLVVGTSEQAHGRRLVVGSLNWVSVPPQPSPFRAEVQIRSSHRAAPATIHPHSRARATVEFDTPQFGIAPGQFAVFYDGDLLLAGGCIRLDEGHA